MVEDPGCLQANANAAMRANELLRQCAEQVESEESQCLASRERTVAEQTKKNEGLQSSVDLLLNAEQTMLAKMRTCDEADGTSKVEL